MTTPLPTDLRALDRWLADGDSALADLRPGLGREIVWARPEAPTKTPLSIVYLHGFSASKGETRPLPDQLAEALGANLYFARLTGHGQGSAALAMARTADWLSDAREAVEIGAAIGDAVILMATSTGGTLVPFLLLDERLTPKIAAALLMAPNFGLRSAGAPLLTAPFAARIVPLLIGHTRGFTPQNELQTRYWTNDYPVAALLPMAALVAEARRLPVETIGTPTFFLYDPEDRIVSSRATDRIYQRWGGPKARAAPGLVEDINRHVIAGDAYSPSGTAPALARMLAFLEDVLPAEKLNPEPALST